MAMMKIGKMQSLVNHFLVAMPHMDDPLFQDGVIYICEHNEDGAMGFLFIIPSPIMLGQLFDQVVEKPIRLGEEQVVFFGGPVQADRGFLLHSPAGRCQSSVLLKESDIAITTSRDILSDIANNNGPEKVLVTLGCSSWSKNQLETEIANNYWLTIPADKNILFNVLPEERYQKALSLIGINAASHMLISEAGHA